MRNQGERTGLVKVGHAELAVTDLGAAREFYVDVLGFLETERAPDRLYLRGNADTDHHCLVLSEGDAPRLLHHAWRVARPEDLEAIERAFSSNGHRVRRHEKGHEAGVGEAITLVDPCGHPVEFYHETTKVESFARKSHLWRGAAVQRLDHIALMTPDVRAGVAYYEKMGLHLSEVVESEDGSGYFGAFLHRTSHSHDVALVRGAAPAMQHLSFWVEDAARVIHAADVVADAGFGASIEFGPGRHKTTNSFFLYLRDPFGNRIEIFSEGYWSPDFDDPPIRWTFEGYQREGRLSFGGQAPQSFFEPIPLGSPDPAEGSGT